MRSKVELLLMKGPELGAKLLSVFTLSRTDQKVTSQELLITDLNLTRHRFKQRLVMEPLPPKNASLMTGARPFTVDWEEASSSSRPASSSVMKPLIGLIIGITTQSDNKMLISTEFNWIPDLNGMSENSKDRLGLWFYFWKLCMLQFTTVHLIKSQSSPSLQTISKPMWPVSLVQSGFLLSDFWITATCCVVLCCVVLCCVVLMTVGHKNDDSRGWGVCSCSSSLNIFPSATRQIPALSDCSQCLSKQALCCELKTETPCQDEKWRPQRDIHTQPAGGWSLQGQMWAGNITANSKYNYISTYWHFHKLWKILNWVWPSRQMVGDV